jgi:predicted hydrolase (HD superfamily)
MAKALFACDELTGLITASALVKPSRAVADVDVPGIRKKMKDKAFARGVNREDVIKGADSLGIPLDEHIGVVLAAMQAAAGQLGLAGLAGLAPASATASTPSGGDA